MIEKKQNSRRETQTLLTEHEKIFTTFVQSTEAMMNLKPMNSYHRRTLHGLAADYGLETHSEGEGEGRYLVVKKTPDARIPAKKAIPVWNYGDREFLVNSRKKEIEVFLYDDGSVGLDNEHQVRYPLASKTVTTGSFKIKHNQILEYSDLNW